MFYLELFRALQEDKVRYLVVGGVAVNLHGIGRLTVDVDLMLALDAQNLERFVSVARRFPLKPVVPVKLEDFADAAKVGEWIENKGMLALALRSSDPATPTVDVLVKPVVPFDDAWARRVQRSVEGIAIPIAAIEDIIRLKTGTGRQKDEADIKALRQLLRMEPAPYAT
ncbi:MAG: hypothetical protein OEW90_04060 [Betaproteobacteria bacterium]|nr:hypothetical protein [Betaproteobacteria bacterium]MDH4323294.1 hypothetical protein [Betaproteobacteria bacterium]